MQTAAFLQAGQNVRADLSLASAGALPSCIGARAYACVHGSKSAFGSEVNENPQDVKVFPYDNAFSVVFLRMSLTSSPLV